MSDDTAPETVACGRVGRAHGVHGDVVVEAWTDAPAERFAVGASLLTPTGALHVERVREHSGRWVVGFGGVDDRTAAAALRGTVLSVPVAQRPPLADPDEYYDTDLEGLAVEDEDGARLGTVSAVLHGFGPDTLAVRDPADREHLIPFVSALVPTVDVPGGRVVVALPDGLWEL